ncbi:FAD-dependent oxidoreductase [Niastella koreensis]|uniref:Fumarate reductase/succinate dehydrogenase flavoprotein domain protein n=2 Tax=Niastella koreensis TaxID=354356 RepID=G8TDM6_NIAKG|nr:FAD-dependent oxidoreductase [Niastella koreensis]AEW01476.1 fumarate reductase/succinate dehydrogenase flavoprotein domain protein [Niastella koreensis GR20-10]OQP48204.1 FAD-dependent oxidoreductase [Niastella koreensis]
MKYIQLLILLLNSLLMTAQSVYKTDVLIIGGGASGTMAGIQCARLGVNTVIVEETNWLGGMLTAAGVSAIDGNHRLPAGLWGEFRKQLYDYYGGADSVETGWVSNTLFEPHTGNELLQKMTAAEKALQVWLNTKWLSVKRDQQQWTVTVMQGNKQRTITAAILIDATELGDVAAAAGAGYRIGMDSRHDTGEEQAPEQANNIIQDLTYVAVLKDYGPKADKTIPKPAGYDAGKFACSCDVSDPASFDSPKNNCYRMMQYGRLPHNKYMINWPKCGNDYYLNLIEKTPTQREQALKEARLHTLRFVYYLQTVLGYKNLGLADDEFTTPDKLPMIPYHRESRRIKGLVTFTLPHVATPYETANPLYRTGIAVGDYTIDHHHLKNTAAPAIDFVKIKVPSYNVPMGSLIPQGIDGLIVAEKSISVSNIVNGATRLQPVVMQLGQAAGVMAALCVQQKLQPAQLPVRAVQEQILKANGYIMPFIDVPVTDKHFAIIQKIGATGILKGTGVPYMWANQTWFYPEQPMPAYELVKGLRSYYPQLNTYWAASGNMCTLTEFVNIAKQTGIVISEPQAISDLQSAGIQSAGAADQLSRRAIAILLTQYLHPFEQTITISGSLK